MYDDTDDDETVNSPVAGPSGIRYAPSVKKANLSGMKPGLHPSTKPAAVPDSGASDTTGHGDEGATNSGATRSCKDGNKVSRLCVARVMSDIKELFTDPPPGVHIAPVENNVANIHALVLGPADTPYDGGFFHFVVECPSEYPVKAPSVRIMNTDRGRVSFHPNLYACGRVCLSILGTFVGPGWTPAHSLRSLLLSIQSILSDRPYFNEPGMYVERQPGDSERYSRIVQHETIRVAVCDAVEACLKGSSQCPPPLREVMLKSFPAHYDKYEKAVMANMRLTGRAMIDPFGNQRKVFEYDKLLRRLRELKEQVEESLKSTDKGTE
ncbi:hypothetical protein HPB50_004840 [Hyalomma asiaticum]|uniref:Uncharacterized protein n=1 Tax=Hyalomma asiaticum TaxID=266040 RepID=A0ACB7SGP3_HYAAI|nr:hypothetical protein HPB50_004840 [Hyalomma asiaticum]